MPTDPFTSCSVWRPRMKRFRAAAIAVGIAAASTCSSAATIDPLKDGFHDPPNPARPRVWWHWMNGNVSKEGISLDLEWMKRIGLGGAENFQAFLGPLGPGQVVHELTYMSAEWQDAFHHAAATAD